MAVGRPRKMSAAVPRQELAPGLSAPAGTMVSPLPACGGRSRPEALHSRPDARPCRPTAYCRLLAAPFDYPRADRLRLSREL
jgi:hypothetical protein